MMFSESQRERLISLHDESWFSESDPADVGATKLSELIGSVESREELFYASNVMPCDLEDGDHWLILDHPFCDYGIALHFYWRCQPDFFYRKEEKKKQLHPFEQVKWDEIRKIEARLSSGHYTESALQVDPAEIVGRPLAADDPYRPGIRLVPRELWKPSSGLPATYDHTNVFPNV